MTSSISNINLRVLACKATGGHRWEHLNARSYRTEPDRGCLHCGITKRALLKMEFIDAWNSMTAK